MSKRKRKKEDTPVEIIIPIFIALIVFSRNGNINKTIVTFIIILIVTLAISFTIRYKKREKKEKNY